MDFVIDSLANTRRLKCLTAVDDFTHESIDITVDRGISGGYVVHVLETGSAIPRLSTRGDGALKATMQRRERTALSRKNNTLNAINKLA